MSVIRAQVVHSHVSGLARDSCVNTFHFNGLITDANLTGIASAVSGFYNVLVARQDMVSRSPSYWLSNVLQNFRVKLYDVTNEPSGAPIADVGPFGYEARPTTQDLPSEAAVCVSYEGQPEAGLIQTRRRGRFYFGPLNVNAIEDDINGVPRPKPDMRDILRLAAQRMAADVDPFAEWVVYSRPYAGRGEVVRPGRSTLPAIAARPGTTVNIDRVWVDDAMDTQRRRGERPTSRGTMLTTV